MSNVNTGGGAHVQGNVSTQKFVGRDEITNVYNQPDRALFAGVPSMPDHFVGRDDLLNTLVDQLIHGGSPALSSDGMPGAGKTTLAVAIAHDARILEHFTDGVLWAGLGTQPDVMLAIGRWADALHVDVTKYPDENSRSQAVKDAIGQRRLLVVIDDAWQIDPARLLRCGGSNCCHLLTTRDRGIARAFAGTDHCQRVPELEPDPAYQLLQTLAPEACAADPPLSRQLAQAVGGLPLAIELLGGYLAAPEHSIFDDLTKEALTELTDPHRRLQLASERLGDMKHDTITLQDTIALSLSDLPEPARQAFRALGAFASKPETFTRDAAEAVTQADARTLALLIARNLLEQSVDTLTLHQVVSDFAWSIPDAAAAARHRAYYLAAINENRRDFPRIAAMYNQVKHAWTHMTETSELIGFLRAIMHYQRLQGLWLDYTCWAQRALTVAERMGQRKDAGTLLNNIGVVYYDLGQCNTALDYYTRALPIRQEVGDRIGEAQTFNNIGAVYDDLGQRNTTLDYYTRALPIWQEVGDRKGEAVTLSNIGVVYHGLGQHEQALAYFAQALPIQEEVGDRAGEAQTLSNIGGVYDHLGQRDKALAYFAQALPIAEEIGDRAGEAQTLSNIGVVYYSIGQREQALAYFTQALSIRREVGDRAGEAVTLSNIGAVCHGLGQREQALAYFTQALSIRREVGDRAGEATTLNNIGWVYDGLGQRERALDYYAQALPIVREVGDHAGEAVTHYNIAMRLQDLGRLADAIAHLRRTVELDQLTQDPDLERDQATLAQLESELAAGTAPSSAS